MAIYGQLLDEIAAVGASDVQLVVRWAQADVKATTLRPSPEVSAEDEEVRQVCALARARGLRVFLLPIIHLERRGRGEWRGTLAPADEEAWWSSYRAFILRYARLAAEAEVALFSVGSELVSRERFEARWRALIQEVRGVFPGRLTYSANWDHFEPVGFWDALDVVGVTAYQELSDQPDPDEEALVRGWEPFIARLRGWAAREGRTYLFTEVGYPSHSEAAHHPWDYRPRGTPDPDLQLRCYRALYRTWGDDPRLEGLFLWNWFGFSDPGDRSYTPRGKPAAALLRFWYHGAAPPSGASPR